ncbi:MAG TPA: response regulator, partial [Pseudomonas sp.]|nr:response regulator [Pseudomonas sp.]
MATTSLLVCDDSAMARKQLLRALPADWPVEISQATNGAEALQRIREGGIDLLLLDLTMPVLDGYGVLAGLRDEGLACRVIVVSGDVQEEAVRRVTELGALAFLKKPADPEIVQETLQRLGLLGQGGAAAPMA